MPSAVSIGIWDTQECFVHKTAFTHAIILGLHNSDDTRLRTPVQFRRWTLVRRWNSETGFSVGTKMSKGLWLLCSASEEAG